MAKIIGLDIGHGKNSAKGVPSMPEFEFNNAVGKITKKLFEHNGFKVVMAQPFDSNTVSLVNRYAKYNGCDILFSVHADANSSYKANGNWAFHYPGKGKGWKLATIWSKYAKSILPTYHRGLRESVAGTWTSMGMVRKTKPPAVLIEHGFMTNPDDLQKLKSTEYRQLCAEVMVRAACEFFGQTFKELPKGQPKPRKKAEKGKYFRVQLGAFSYDDNAEDYQEELKNKFNLDSIIKYY